MHVLLLGATGSVGRLVAERALERGHVVTALARNPQKLGGLQGSVSVVAADALDAPAVSGALVGQHAVIYTLGAG